MRRIFGLVAVVVMLVGSGVARAQFVDPSTGIPVDPVSDPLDFVNAMSGQPTNIGTELAAQATEQVQALTAQHVQDAMAATLAVTASAAEESSSGPMVARTQKPAMTPNGGSFRGSVQVAIADKDAKAMVHYTTDGSKPTGASATYVAPLMVTATTKVDGSELPSGVVTKRFELKS
jgi:hypothetical protein